MPAEVVTGGQNLLPPPICAISHGSVCAGTMAKFKAQWTGSNFYQRRLCITLLLSFCGKPAGALAGLLPLLPSRRRCCI